MSIASLDKIINETMTVIENNKNQIYDIAENARTESERVKKEMLEVQRQVMATIERVDSLEKLEKAARIRLMEVSRNFKKYTEDDIRLAYEKARELQLELGTLRERESQLRIRRNELERSLRKLQVTVEKAESLITQVGVVLDYLGGNLKSINDQLEVFQQKQQLAPKIIQAQEEERKRVAREIHDGPAQSMANVVLRTEVCEKLMDIDQAAARKELRELRQAVKNSLQDVRRIIFDLRPMALDDLGLAPAISRYMEKLKENHDISVQVVCTGQPRRVGATQEVAIFRIIQEAVQNTIKHARARHIHVFLDMGPRRIAVTIKDDGIGFDYEAYLKEPRPESYGILGMKERLDILGGELSIKSKPGEGTELLVILPLDLEGER
mgnify:CR=1 FL=1